MLNFHRALNRQRGATAVMTALVFSTVALASLVSIDVGYLYMQQRNLQKVADMAALAAVQSIPGRVSIAAASAAANDYISQGAADTVTPTAGYWDPALLTDSPHFSETVPATASANAVRVVVRKENPTFFAGLIAGLADRNRPRLEATAIARVETMIGLSLGTGVTRLGGPSVLNQTLSMLLGTTVTLDAVAYQGLAAGNISLGALMAELGVGTVEELVGLDTQLGPFVEAALGAAARDGLLTGALAQAGAVSSLVNGIRDVTLRVANEATGTGTPAVLSIAALLGNVSAAVDAKINVLDLITTAAQVANANAGISIDNLAIDLGPLAKVTLQTRVITPPVIAIGPPGAIQAGAQAGQWHTVARSAAARVRLVVEAVNIGIVKVKLPLEITVAPAEAKVASAQCAIPKTDSIINVSVDTGVASACIAALPANMGASYLCSALPRVNIAEITLPLLPSIGIGIKTSVPLEAATQTLQFDGDEIGATKTVNTNGLGSSLASALFGPNSALEVDALGINLSLLGDVIATVLYPVLYPVLLLLDPVLQPVLGLLGIQLGFSDVKLTSVLCNKPALVF